MTTWERLFDATRAFDHPVTIGVVAFIVVGLICASVLIRVLKRLNKLTEETQRELIARTRSWYVLAAAMIIPILLGAAWICGFFLVLSLFCFREYSRATGLNQSRTSNISVVCAIAVVYFAVLDNWSGLFAASAALGVCSIAVIELIPDSPNGYIKRVALSAVGFALFGVGIGHLAFISNDDLFRPILLWILLCTELNDVFAYLAGKSFGKHKMLPKTSPNKTWGGAIGAVVATTTLSAFIGHFVFLESPLSQPIHLVLMGLIISVLGQCGDLVISSIKRDLGIKDMADVIPGHGGILDRFDSLLLVAPVLFHYINYFGETGIGNGQSARIISG